MVELDWDFPKAEYERRVRAVREDLAARKIEVLIVDQFEHLVYLFGYLPTAAKYQACILPLEGPPHMIVRAMDRPVFDHQSWVGSYREFADADDPLDILLDELAGKFRSVSTIGLEMDSHILTAGRYRYLTEKLRHCRFVDFSGVLAEKRLIKSPAEIRYLRQAGDIADKCITGAIETAGVGVNERTAAAEAYRIALQAGADNGRVLLGASGAQSGSIHGRLGTRTLADGDILHLEMVPQVRGYSARLMRPTSIGSPKPELVSLAERLVEIQDGQIAAMAPGKTGGEIDAIGRERIIAEVDPSYRNHTGYTLGYHAQPRTSDHTRIFTPTAAWTLRAGMVFHMFVAVRGIAFGETILVTPMGCERLTQTSRQLFLRQ
ncbi:MAG: M24 family metallopeptidase [Parvibaculaceae bacterium]